MDRVCHFEIPFDDKPRVTDFYERVFGWQFSDVPGDMPYTFAITTPVDEKGSPTASGGINGGLYPRGEGGASGSPVIVIEVDSCQARTADVEAGGGEVVMGPAEIPGMGVYAQIRDPEGNIVGLWQPLT